MNRALRLAPTTLIFDIAFAVYHLASGFFTSSWWLITLGSYYLILSVVRFVVLCLKSKERFAIRFTGWMLISLSIPLVGTVALSVVKDRGLKLHMIVMITMAVYAFAKITLATINLIKTRRHASATLLALRNISFADALVSIFALQRSMLVSFEGMSEAEIVIMNASLGIAVCVTVLCLGIRLLKHERRIKPDAVASQMMCNKLHDVDFVQ